MFILSTEPRTMKTLKQLIYVEGTPVENFIPYNPNIDFQRYFTANHKSHKKKVKASD